MAERLDPLWVERQLGDPATQAVVASAKGAGLTPNARSHIVLRVPVPAAANHEAHEPGPWSRALGLDDGVALFAIDLDAQPP